MEKMKLFLLGALTTLCLLLILGMSSDSQNGRYQITSYGEAQTGWVYVIDTNTGVVKLVKSNTDMQLGIPFEKLDNYPK